MLIVGCIEAVASAERKMPAFAWSLQILLEIMVVIVEVEKELKVTPLVFTIAEGAVTVLPVMVEVIDEPSLEKSWILLL